MPAGRFSDWLAPAKAVSLFIDEFVPEESGEIEGFAVVAVRHSNVGERAWPLSFVKDHLKDDFQEFDQALKSLVRCEDARVLVLPVVGGNRRNYDGLLRVTVELCLGWLLQQPDGKQRLVEIDIDRYRGHPAGSDAAELFRQMFAADDRMQGWRIDRFRWVDAEGEHAKQTLVPYADAVAYLLHRVAEYAAPLRLRYQLERWPGYVPIWPTLIDELRALDVSGKGAAPFLLDLATRLDGTAFWRTLLGEWKKRIQDAGSSSDLLDELADRFRKKDRNLRALSRQLNAVDQLVGSSSIKKNPRAALLHALVHVQDANHAGDPERSRDRARLYSNHRKLALEKDPNLAVWCELNIAVSEADAMDYDHALERIHELIESDVIERIGARERGQLFSAYGQYLSMAQDFESAEDSFVRATEEFEGLWESESVIASETEQTGTYRLINAIDYCVEDSTTARDALAQSVGSLLGNASKIASQLSADPRARNPFVHHALLRLIWWIPEYRQSRSAYLETAVWSEGEGDTRLHQHPWELIWMYRGLVAQDPDNTSSVSPTACFDRALDIVGLHRGTTFKLIGGMIAAVAACATGKPEYAEQGQEILDTIESRMPRAQTIVNRMRSVMSAPEPSKVNQTLAVLPFNYH